MAPTAVKNAKTFISYAQEDAAFALKLANDLRDSGAAIWIDQPDIAPGARWDHAVEDVIESCSRLLVILSPTAVSSETVIREVSYALDQHKAVIPVLYKDCEVPLRLRRHQLVDVRGGIAELLPALERAEVRRPRVFLCHASGDKPVVRDLYRRLQQDGVEPWLDEQDLPLGQDWETEIRKVVRDSDVVLVCLSQRAITNEGFVQKEIEFVLDAVDERPEGTIFIIPLKLEACTTPERLKRSLWTADFSAVNGYERLVSLLHMSMPGQGIPGCPSSQEESDGPTRGGGLSRALHVVRYICDVRWWFKRVTSRFKLMMPTDVAPPNTRTDDVHFSVTAPATLLPGEDAELIVWAHLQEQERVVLRKAMAALGVFTLHKVLLRSVGPIQVHRGTLLSVALDIEGITIANPHNRITWTGGVGNANFVLSVAEGATEGTRKAACFIRVNGLEVGRIDFLLRVGTRKGKQEPIPGDLVRYKKAFASYASEDRDAVLKTIHGMHKITPDLDVFVDVMTLRSGEEWEQKLNEVIPKVDVFYLFWCRHALRSPWVEKEWRCAYNARGIAFIDPVPLEGPDVAPPPQELSSKHFNDPILAFIKYHNK